MVIGAVLPGILVALRIIFLYVFLPYLAISIVYLTIRTLYHAVSPEAKRSYLEKKANEAEEIRKIKKQEEVEAKAKKELKEKKIQAERKKREAERKSQAAEKRRKEFDRQQLRDGDRQATPYKYKIGRHGNESLAIRYGIANQERKVKEYWYYAKSGERSRNPDRDEIYYGPAETIRLQKVRKLSKDTYEVLLADYRNRKGKAIIEVGTEYVKTFYPVDDIWFEKHADLERTLKGNNSFTLKELGRL